MKYYWKYKTPEGFDDLVMTGDRKALTGLWFEGSTGAREIEKDSKPVRTRVFGETCRWLDEYFSGRAPDFTPAYRIDDPTPFRKAVVDAMLRIPFGGTASYGDIAREIAKKQGEKTFPARAVGGAVGWNPIVIIIPCHRVIGSDDSLTGYGGGIKNKVALLALEGAEFNYSSARDPAAEAARFEANHPSWWTRLRIRLRKSL